MCGYQQVRLGKCLVFLFASECWILKEAVEKSIEFLDVLLEANVENAYSQNKYVNLLQLNIKKILKTHAFWTHFSKSDHEIGQDVR